MIIEHLNITSKKESIAMSTFKNQVLTILNENENKKVSSIISLIEELSEKRQPRQKSYILDDNNNPIAIFCYYHKHWELINETEYGLKSNSKTGLNTMCKLGTNRWTKQQKVAKQEQAKLLEKLMSKEVTIQEAETVKQKIENDRLSIDLEHSIGYTFDEVMKIVNK